MSENAEPEMRVWRGDASSREQSERRQQVAKQLGAVAHLAARLAAISTDLKSAYERGELAALINMHGDLSARQIEMLGDTLNSMDALAASDDWIIPILDAAQKAWPAPAEKASCE